MQEFSFVHLSPGHIQVYYVRILSDVDADLDMVAGKD